MKQYEDELDILEALANDYGVDLKEMPQHFNNMRTTYHWKYALTYSMNDLEKYMRRYMEQLGYKIAPHNSEIL